MLNLGMTRHWIKAVRRTWRSERHPCHHSARHRIHLRDTGDSWCNSLPLGRQGRNGDLSETVDAAHPTGCARLVQVELSGSRASVHEFHGSRSVGSVPAGCLYQPCGACTRSCASCQFPNRVNSLLASVSGFCFSLIEVSFSDLLVFGNARSIVEDDAILAKLIEDQVHACIDAQCEEGIP